MPRAKPKKSKEPFFVDRSDLLRRLDSLPAIRLGEDDSTPRPRDWVAEEEEAFIKSVPHLREQVASHGRENVPLMWARIQAKKKEGALSLDEFRQRLEEKGDYNKSIIDLLSAAHAFCEDECSRRDAFCPVDLYVLYLKHRVNPADDLLAATYRSTEGVQRLAALEKKAREFAIELRWLLPLSECIPRQHPMPDELRRSILRAAGTQSNPDFGWIATLQRWLIDAANLLKQPSGGKTRPKEAAFQLEFYNEAMDKRNDPLWEVGRRLFLMIFPEGRTDRYLSTGDYRRVVQRRLKSRRAG